jgi:ankyrin repeat protein
MAQRLGESKFLKAIHRAKALLSKPLSEAAAWRSSAKQKRLNSSLVDVVPSGLFLHNAKAEMAKLISLGADVNARDFRNNTALMWTANNGYTEALKFLLEKGADVSAKNDLGQTALMDAAKMGYFDACNILVKNGADICAMDKIGRTALHHAKWLEHSPVHPQIVKFLEKRLLMRIMSKNAAGRFLSAFRECAAK